MALTISKIMQLPIMKKLILVAGNKGLDNYVVSAGIVDHEYSNHSKQTPIFDEGSFVVSSLLFAAENPDLILVALKDLHSKRISAFAYKDVIYDNLPAEAIDFANTVGLPIFKFDSKTYSENIIFGIMDVVKNEDSAYLTETNIKSMIDGNIQENVLENIISNISIEIKNKICCYYISKKGIDANSIYRRYSSYTGFNNKLFICRYKKGLFVITTDNSASEKDHEIILNQFLDIMGINKFNLNSSGILDKYKLDIAIQRSYQCYISNLLSIKVFNNYSEIGLYKVIIPYYKTIYAKRFSNEIIIKLSAKDEYMDTAKSYVENGGDIMSVAIELNCHHSTIRYRLQKIKELIKSDNCTEQELYAELFVALKIEILNKISETE